MNLGTHKAVFRWVLKRLAEQGLLSGKNLGVDATTPEANAALRSIVAEVGVGSIIAEPERKWQKWTGQAAGQAAVHAQRRRLQTTAGLGSG